MNAEVRCPTCGNVQRSDHDERNAAEIALARVMALMKQPGGLALMEQILRHLQALRGAGARLIALEGERAVRR